MNDLEMWAAIRRKLDNVLSGQRQVTSSTRGEIEAEVATALRPYVTDSENAPMFRYPTGMVAAQYRSMGIDVPCTIPDDAELWVKGWNDPTVIVDQRHRPRMNVRMEPIDPEWVVTEQSA